MLTILAIPPIVSRIIGHDDIVYPAFLTVFTVCLFIRGAQVLAKWNTWIMDLPTVTDQNVVDWYCGKCTEAQKDDFQALSIPAAMQVAHTALYNAVSEERRKKVWSKPIADKLVLGLAKAYTTSAFILSWYSNCTGAPKPLPYSSTWNGQIKTAVESLRASDKGLRLHNAFVHWRYAKAEIAYGFMYFILALLDRWVELFCGGSLIGVLILSHETAGISMGFSLMYYLSAAYILDLYAVRLYAVVNVSSSERITSLSNLENISRRDTRRRSRLYWTNLGKIFMFHLWGLAIYGSIVWAFVDDQQSVLIFFSYGLAYLGLLWFQYNKIFALDAAVKPHAVGIFVGFLVGIPLRKLRPNYWFIAVLSLAAGTWTAALLTFFSLDLPALILQEPCVTKSSARAQRAIGPQSSTKDERLSDLFDQLSRLPTREIVEIKLPGGLIAGGILRKLLRGKASSKAPEITTAFPHLFDLLHEIIISWESGEIIVYGVSLENMVGPDHDLCAVSRKISGTLKIFVGLDVRAKDWMGNFEYNTSAYVHYN